MKRSWGLMILILAGANVGPNALADSPQAEVAARGWAITDAVMARHVDPPTRQQMLLAGIRSWLGENPAENEETVALSAKPSDPKMNDRLPLRVSNLANSDQLAALLTELAPKSTIKDLEARDEAFFSGLLASVPAPAFLLSPKERKVTESFEANLYVGIQVALGLDEKLKKPALQTILEGGPADHAGLQSGDLIDEVDGVSAEGMPLVKVIDRLRGAEGTEVVLKCTRPSSGQTFTKTLTRSRLPRASIEGLTQGPDKRWKFQLEGNPTIAYVKIKEITGSTPRELRAVAETLESEGAKALVLDLRSIRTAGFHSTILVADALLDGGVIGRVASPEGERVIKAEPDALFRDWPMVVLTDPNWVGEVAWLAWALQDNKRATLVGSNLVAADPLIREIVPLGNSDWAIQMSTGRLEKGDGQPLDSSKIPLALNSRLTRNFEADLDRTLAVLNIAQAEQTEALKQLLDVQRQLLADQKDLSPQAMKLVNERLNAAAATLKSTKTGTFKEARPFVGNLPPRQPTFPEPLAKAQEILEAALKGNRK